MTDEDRVIRLARNLLVEQPVISQGFNDKIDIEFYEKDLLARLITIEGITLQEAERLIQYALDTLGLSLFGRKYDTYNLLDFAQTRGYLSQSEMNRFTESYIENQLHERRMHSI